MVFMSENWRSRRSVLFMPASNRKALEKARTLGCDGLIFDLEDSVADNQQEEARQNLLELVKDVDFVERETVVRISAPGTNSYARDVEAAILCKPDAILIPKVENSECLRNLSEVLDASGGENIAIWAMIETPLALINLKEICSYSNRLTCLVVGPNDLAKSTGVAMISGRAPMLPWFMDVLAHGRSFGQSVLDGVYNNFRDEMGFVEECNQGAQMGFDGKTLIHPAQISGANTAFSPSESDIQRAQSIVQLFADQKTNQGATQLDGEMIEELHLDSAKQLLALVDKLG